MKYFLVSKNTFNGLNEYIQEFLDEGWELYGEPIITKQKDSSLNHFRYSQAVIKKDKNSET